jgi:hypothetical protein
MAVPSLAATTLFLVHTRPQILDIVMRNLSEPHRFLLLAELSECRLRVSLRKFWAAFSDPFSRTTYHFFLAGADSVECMRKFAERHQYTRFKLPASVMPPRAELWRNPERAQGLYRALPEIVEYFRPYWEVLYEKRTPWTRRDFCLLRIAQVTGALKLDEPALRGLRIIFDVTVRPIIGRKLPRPTWDELLRPDVSKILRPVPPYYPRRVFDPIPMIFGAIELEQTSEEEDQDDVILEPPAAKRFKMTEVSI